MQSEKRDKGIIPNEILSTLTGDLGYSWLIRGLAGCGKTTFALTLLEKFSEEFEPIYISSRVSPPSLYKQFPFLQESLKEMNILDASRTYIPPVRGDVGFQMKEHLKQTLQFSSVPDFLKIIYDKVEKYNNPIIVIDSWDAIMNISASKEELNNLETLFTEFVRQTKAKLILIAESDQNTFLDYIVDGIITLNDEDIVPGRTIRVMTINKIRKHERIQKDYIFSLYNNQFNVCLPFRATTDLQVPKFSSFEDRNGLFSTGIEALDAIYAGGFTKGTFNLLEVESNIPVKSYSQLIINIICIFISNKRGVLISAMDGINSDLIDKRKLFISLDTAAISKYMRILQEKLIDRIEIRPYIIQAKEENTFNDLFFETYAKLSAKTKFQPIFAACAYDTIKFMVNFEEEMSNFYKHIKLIRNSNVIELGIINSQIGQKSNSQTNSHLITEDLSYISNTHLKILERHGSIIIYGVKPRTGLFELKNLPNNEIELRPIV